MSNVYVVKVETTKKISILLDMILRQKKKWYYVKGV